MGLYQLRSFVAIAGAGNLTRAAEKLHPSQPAVRALFDRHRVEPSTVVDAGQEFVIAKLIASGAKPTR